MKKSMQGTEIDRGLENSISIRVAGKQHIFTSRLSKCGLAVCKISINIFQINITNSQPISGAFQG